MADKSDLSDQVAQQLTHQCFNPLQSRWGPRAQASHLTLTFLFPPKLCTVQILHLDTAQAHVMAIPFPAQGTHWHVEDDSVVDQGAGSAREPSLLAVRHQKHGSMAMLAIALAVLPSNSTTEYSPGTTKLQCERLLKLCLPRLQNRSH